MNLKLMFSKNHEMQRVVELQQEIEDLHAEKKFKEVLTKLEELQEITKVNFGTQSTQVSVFASLTIKTVY